MIGRRPGSGFGRDESAVIRRDAWLAPPIGLTGPVLRRSPCRGNRRAGGPRSRGLMAGLSSTRGDRLGWYARRLRSMTPGEVLWRGARLVGQRVPRRSLEQASDSQLLGSGNDGWERVCATSGTASGGPCCWTASRARRSRRGTPTGDRAAQGGGAHPRRRRHVLRHPETPLGCADRLELRPRPRRALARRATPHASTTGAAAATPSGSGSSTGSSTCRGSPRPGCSPATTRYAERGARPAGRLDRPEPAGPRDRLARCVRGGGAGDLGGRRAPGPARTRPALDPGALRAGRAHAGGRRASAAGGTARGYSSANNHLVGELAGLATVAMLFPELAAAARWERRRRRAPSPSRRPGRSCPTGRAPSRPSATRCSPPSCCWSSRRCCAAAAGRRRRLTLLAAVGPQRGVPRRPSSATATPTPRYGDDDEGFALRLGPEPRPRRSATTSALVAALTGNRRGPARRRPT